VSASRQNVRAFDRCENGTWCALGRFADEGNASLSCPAATFCENPFVLTPTICDWDGECTSASCPLIPYCPAGTTRERLCDEGFYCPSTAENKTCSAGMFCPVGSPLWQLCPSGSFCPVESQSGRLVKIPCPAGAYCPEGTIDPIDCGIILPQLMCPEGTEEPPLLVLFFFILAFVTSLLAVGLWKWRLRAWCATRNLERKRLLTLQRKVAQEKHARTLGQPLLEVAAEKSTPASSAADFAHVLSESDILGYTVLDDTVTEVGEPMDLSAPDLGTVSQLLRAVKTSSGPLAGESGLSLEPKTYTIDIRFENLGLQLKEGSKAHVLAGVTGELRHGHVCAVMGPSGAGKTTFLTALCGKASYGNLTGEVFINEVPGLLTDAKYKHLVGFVPQEDIMMRDLSV